MVESNWTALPTNGGGTRLAIPSYARLMRARQSTLLAHEAGRRAEMSAALSSLDQRALAVVSGGENKGPRRREGRHTSRTWSDPRIVRHRLCGGPLLSSAESSDES